PMITGLANQTYGILYSTSPDQPAPWRGLANTTLSASTNFWQDPEASTVSRRFYRLVPGPIPIPPRIVTQPQGADLYWGGSVTLSSTAAGDAPLTYQWQKNGVPISGATNPSLVITNLQSTNAGNYSLLVTNSIGSALSSAALLNVSVANLSLVR